MLRFLTALAVLGAVLLGYDRWMAGRARAPEEPVSMQSGQEAVSPDVPEPGIAPAPEATEISEPTRAPPLLASAADTESDDDPAATAVLGELEEAPAEAVAAALQMLAADRIPDRARQVSELNPSFQVGTPRGIETTGGR